MAESKISTPAGFGGLMRYKEEYPSKFTLDPKHILIFIGLVIVFVTVLKVFFPIA